MKKFLAGILCICLLVTMLPYTALAEGTTDSGDTKNATDEVIASNYSESSGINAQPGMYFPALGEDSAADGIKDLQDGSWVKYDNITFSGSECAFSVDYATTGGSGSLKVYVDEIKEENLIVSASKLTGGSYGWATVENHEVTLSKQVEAGEHSVIIEGGDVLKKADGSYQWDARTAGIRSFKFVEGEWVAPNPGETPGGDGTDGTPNGHQRMYATDATLTGNGVPSTNEGNELAPTHMGWIYPNDTQFTFENVSLTDAAYVRLCSRLNPASEVTGVFEIYLDEETAPAAVVNVPKSQDFRLDMAALTDTVSGTHTVRVVLAQAMPDLSWIQFLTAADLTDGHDRMYMVDSNLSGNFGAVTGNSDPLAPSHIGWTGVGTAATFEGVRLDQAEYVQLCLKSFAEDTGIEVYLDQETEPVASFTLATNMAFHLETAALTKVVSGVHTVTVKITANGPDLSWIQFATEEALMGKARNGHERMLVTDADSRSGGEVVFFDSVLAPSHLGWVGAGTTINYNYVALNDAKYVQLCSDAHIAGNQVDILLGSSQEPIASFKFDINKTKNIQTIELPEAITDKQAVTVKITAGAPDYSWLRFLSEDKYAAIDPITVALVGDSNIEYGHFFNGMTNLLDPDDYLVQAYGHAGATVESYQATDAYRKGMASASDLYIITLGTNDAMYSEDYITNNTGKNYEKLIDNIRAANPDAVIYAQTPLPLREDDLPDGTNPGDPDNRTVKKLTEYIIPAIREACAKKNVPVIDIYNGMLNLSFSREQYLSDYVHVNAAGGKMMAQLTYDAIFTDGYGEGSAPGTVDSVTITVPKAELTQKGETMTLTANTDVYWKVLSADGTESSTFATIDEDGVLTAVKPGAYQVVATSKADTSVKDAVLLYNRFAYKAAEVDYIFGTNYSKRESFDVRDGGVRVVDLNDGLSFYLKDVDLTGVTSVTVRAYSRFDNTAHDSSLEFHLNTEDGPMIANSVIKSTKLATSDNTARYGDFKSGVVPVNDGALHDVYAVVNLEDDFYYDMLSIEFGTDEENPVIVRDGEVVDTYSENYTWKAGEYTLYSTSESLPVVALYDEDGKAEVSVLLTEDGGVRKASFTLSKDMPGAAMRTYHWKDLTSMEPVTPEYMTYQAPITIGCVGDSITRELNDETDNDNMLSYPKFLQLALGDRYEVKNFGRGSATIGSYYERAAYGRAVAAACDIYVIQLGTNDAREGHSTNLEAEYQRIIDGLLDANPQAKIYICLPYPVFGSGNYGIVESILVNDIIPAVKKVAEDNNLPTINVHDEVLAHERVDEFDRGDNIHPKDVGMTYLAEIIENGIFGK